jgi:hypothetical protein
MFQVPMCFLRKATSQQLFRVHSIVKPTKRRGNDDGGENTFRKITTTSLLFKQDPEIEKPTNNWQNKSQTPQRGDAIITSLPL